MSIDLTTAAFLAGTSGVLAALLVRLACGAIPSIWSRGAGPWSVGLCLYGVAFLMIAFRQRVPEWMPSVLGNGLLVLSFVPIAVALRRFDERPERATIVFGVAIAVFCSLENLWLLSVSKEVNWRLGIGTLCQLAVVFPILSSVPMRGLRTGPGAYVLIATFLGFGLILVHRSTIFLLGEPMLSAIERPNAQTLSYFAIVLLPAMATAGFLALCSQRMHEELRRLADTDALTGCLNRRAFAVAARGIVGQARVQGVPVSLLLLDLDHLKMLNDRHGHFAGDALLLDLTHELRNAVGPQGIVARIGGDEFLVLLAGVDLPATVGFIRRLRARLIVVSATRAFPISVSIGMAAFQHEDDLESVLAQADAAMYADKSREDRSAVKEWISA